MSIFSGRLNRTGYFGAIFVYAIIYFFVFQVIDTGNPAYLFVINLLGLSFLPFVIKRLHDLGISGWLSILIFIPFIGLILGGALVFQQGENKSNRYGTTPK